MSNRMIPVLLHYKSRQTLEQATAVFYIPEQCQLEIKVPAAANAGSYREEGTLLGTDEADLRYTVRNFEVDLPRMGRAGWPDNEHEWPTLGYLQKAAAHFGYDLGRVDQKAASAT